MFYCNENKPQYCKDGSIISFGNKLWFQNYQLHRLDGPAIEWRDGKFSWYYHGKYIKCSSQAEFERIIRLKLLW